VGFGLPSLSRYPANHSILWAIIDGILGWLYMIYHALFPVIKPVSWDQHGTISQSGADLTISLSSNPY
jgi:hypothetical protein